MTTHGSVEQSVLHEYQKANGVSSHSAAGIYGQYVKRPQDVALSLLLLVLLSPLLLIIAILIRLGSPGPVIFWQERLGYGCRLFRMYKFRTMFNGAHRLESSLADTNPDCTFFKVENDPRVTKLGRVLRKYSLDEIPQLVNVLRSDMSLIGPRPLLLSDYSKFPKNEQMRRFAMKPGMTGLWQISGRSEKSDQERMDLDLYYVDNLAFWRDLKIFLKTLPAVVRARGAY